MFRVGGEKASTIEARLVPEQADSLACDNVAYLHLPALRSLQVYVSPSLPAYGHALRAIESINVHTEPSEASYDLVITDRAEDLNLEATTRLCVGIVPGDLAEVIQVKEQPCAVVDWSRTAPLLHYVELGELSIMHQPCCREGITDSDLENNGYEVLAHGDKGPLLVQKQEPDRLSFFLLFHSDHSTLPYRVGFPVLVSNLVQVAMQQAGLAEARGLQTGVLGGIVLRPSRRVTVRPPEGAAVEQTTDEGGVLSGVPAPRVGYYRISEGGELWARLGVALLDASETSLQGVDKITFDEELSVAASAKELKTDRPLWPILALLAFCVMLGEWWYFQRGAGGSTQ